MPPKLESKRPLLNVGCGRCYHSDWHNIDLVAASSEVRQYNLCRGLPYPEQSFEGVYHSHVLEHLSPADARSMLTECHRVLRPGGVLRVVVPDLEGIARVYLETLKLAAEQLSSSDLSDAQKRTYANHQWMTIELIDQLTRSKRGGQMKGPFTNKRAINRDFIESRMGHQLTGNDNQTKPRRKTIGQRLGRIVNDIRRQLSLAAVTLIDGRTGRAAYKEGRFRQSGEVHRWMYDRVSLARLLLDIGFKAPAVCAAGESSIENFDGYQLDRDGENARKPDSLYMEAIKPNAVASSSGEIRRAA